MKTLWTLLIVSGCVLGLNVANAEEKTAETSAEKAESVEKVESKEKSESTEKTEPKAEATAEAKMAAYQKAFADWKEFLGALQALRQKFPQAKDDAERQSIIDAHDKLVESAESKQMAWLNSAWEAYLANPNKDEELNEIVVQYLVMVFREDRYEKAIKMAEQLIEKKHADPQVYEFAAISHYSLENFEKAQAYFKKAKAAGGLGQMGIRYVEAADKYVKYAEEEAAIRKAEAKANNLPRVKVETTKGDITIELFENEAPNTVASFISLVEKGFYDGTVFHRVLPNFMAQGGDPTGTGGGGPGYNIKCECYGKNFRKHFRGSLSMAHAGRDTGGSQFFMTFLPTDHLNGRHTVFGRIIEGIDVLAELQRRDPSDPQQRGIEPDKIKKATVIRKRDHDYKVEKLPGR